MYFIFLTLIPFFSSFASGSISPAISVAEIKVLLPCNSRTKLPGDKSKQETIFFYEPANPTGNYPLNQQGLILRGREAVSPGAGFEVTTKYRTKTGLLFVNANLYQQLSNQASAGNFKFKCEADVSYGIKINLREDSCSLTEESREMTTSHRDFMAMLEAQVKPLPSEQLSTYRFIEIKSTSWKLKTDQFNSQLPAGQRPLELKKVNVEIWQIASTCLLEISSKVDLASADQQLAALVSALKAIGLNPDQTPQGQKTKRAYEAAPSGWSKL
jgi:hypothetical protein